jgi:hypothetical protein
MLAQSLGQLLLSQLQELMHNNNHQRPQRPVGRDGNLAQNTSKPPSGIGQISHTESSRGRDLPQTDNYEDDDAFMEPLPRQPLAKKQCINATAKVQY